MATENVIEQATPLNPDIVRHILSVRQDGELETLAEKLQLLPWGTIHATSQEGLEALIHTGRLPGATKADKQIAWAPIRKRDISVFPNNFLFEFPLFTDPSEVLTPLEALRHADSYAEQIGQDHYVLKKLGKSLGNRSHVGWRVNRKQDRLISEASYIRGFILVFDSTSLHGEIRFDDEVGAVKISAPDYKQLLMIIPRGPSEKIFLDTLAA